MTFLPNTDAPQQNTDALGPSNVPPPNIDLDEEWAEPTLEDDIANVDSSDDEQRPRNLEFNERTDIENVRLAKGMKFPNSQVFRKALKEYVIQNHIDVKRKLNGKKKIYVHCKNNCGWRCYASTVTGECTFEIKTLYPECTCPLTFKNGQVTSAYVVKRYFEDFGKNSNWEVSGVKYHVTQKISIDLSLSQVYRSRKAARRLITRNEEAQYGPLRDYAEVILRTDVGSRVILQTKMENENAEPNFKIMYIRYNAQKFVDDIGRPKELNLVFVSDRQKGLLPAMETLFPTVKHRYCVKHIYNNFKVKHKGMELKSVLWRCASATSAKEFERGMDHLKSLNEEVSKYLADIEPKQWTRSHFSLRALTDCMVNNLSESFNSMIVKARDKPILSLLEWIRVRLISRLYIKKTGIKKYGGKLCPSIQKKLEQLKLECKSFCAMPSRRFVYEVDNERKRHVVDLVNRTCSCRVWDLTGIPCKHRVAAIFVNREKPKDYTHPCYYKDAYIETYKTPIPPMLSQSKWMSSDQPKPVAPMVYKPPGKPPMKRKRDADEPNPYKVSRANRPVRCGMCQKEGHNARGCKANVTSETPWEKRQRLQKGKSGSGMPSTHKQRSQTPYSSQTQSSAQPPPTHQPYTMASSSSNQVAGSQPQAPAPQPQAPAPQPQASWLGPPAPWSQNPSQWYSSNFRYTVRGAPWFSSSQPAPHTPAETWDSRASSSQGVCVE
nr:uncharacterized protein LOC111998902 [Quercus suber]